MTPGHSLGSRSLLRWRHKSELTQREAADSQRLGIDHGRYSALECGRARPGLELAVEIERVTGGAVPAESWLEADPGPLVLDVEAHAS